MRRVVVDADVLLSWFDPADGPGRAMRGEYEAGALAVVAPRTILADGLALLAQRPGWTPERLERAAVELERLGLDLQDPAPTAVARYLARGLPAHRAAYPALAAGLDLRLHTLDPELARVAGPFVATP